MTADTAGSMTAAGPEAGGDERPSPWRLPWNELVDGRLRRFRRGVHYSGLGEALEQEARDAAGELGKTAITFRDNMQVFEYVWVQFVDGRLEEGEPCPKCSNTSFEKLQEYFLRCTRCRSFFAVTEPKPVIPQPPKPPAVGEFLGLRLLSTAGAEVSEVSVQEELIAELTCAFHQPVWAIHVKFQFDRAGAHKIIEAGSPDVIRVTEPETVKFALRVSAELLTPGRYVLSPSVKFVRDEDADDTEVLKGKRPSKPLRVFRPKMEEPRSQRRQQPKLAWRTTDSAGTDLLPPRRGVRSPDEGI
jgi:hypothetical protein